MAQAKMQVTLSFDQLECLFLRALLALCRSFYHAPVPSKAAELMREALDEIRAAKRVRLQRRLAARRNKRL